MDDENLRNLRRQWTASSEDDSEKLHIAFEDAPAFARDVRGLFLQWPEVPSKYGSYYDLVAGREEAVDMGESHRLQAFVQMWEFCRELAQNRGRGRALPALEEHAQFFSQKFEAADRELREVLQLHEELREEDPPSGIQGSIPAVNEMRELRRRLEYVRTDFEVKRRALQVFTRRFAVSLDAGPELSEEEAEKLARPGNPGTAANNPEQIRDVLEVALRVADDYDPDGKHISFEEVRTAVKKQVPMLGSASGIDYAVKNAVEHMQCEYGADVPKPTCTVAYYANNDSELRRALGAFVDERFPKNSGEGF